MNCAFVYLYVPDTLLLDVSNPYTQQTWCTCGNQYWLVKFYPTLKRIVVGAGSLCLSVCRLGELLRHRMDAKFMNKTDIFTGLGVAKKYMNIKNVSNTESSNL